jgi:hypothetical protein
MSKAMLPFGREEYALYVGESILNKGRHVSYSVLGATAKIEHVTSSWIRSLFLTILTP